jgi:superfamily II DNA or RNA helicase
MVNDIDGEGLMVNLFADQAAVRDDIKTAMRKNRRILVQAETGFGKTVLGASMIAGSREKQNTSLFMVPRRELLKQTAKTFHEYNLPFSYISAGHQMNPYSKTFLATTGTLMRRLDKIPVPKVVFIDEAHYAGETNKKVADYFEAKGAWIVGLTATPEYPDGDGMGDCYDHMVCGPTMRWLIDNKRLSDYRLFAPSAPNLEGLKVVGGDYEKGKLADRMEHDSILIGDAAKHYREHAMGRLAIAYCTSRKHSELVAQRFRNAGIPAAHVDGETPDDEMIRILRAFAKREILVLCNADLLLFGFDLSAATGMNVTVECMIDLRPTLSRTLQRQKNGRTLRYKDYPAIILDHGGNAMKHGMPCDEIPWTLAAKMKKPRGEAGEKTSAVKQCGGGHKDGVGLGEKMKACHFTHPPAPRCPNCGCWYEVDSRMVTQVDGELVEVSRIKAAMSPHETEKMQEALDRITENAIAGGIPRHKAQAFAAKKVSEMLIKGARK